MMTQKTHLTRSIETADEKAQYDEYAKRIVADKNILAWIAKYTMQELKEYSIPVIISCIEGEPEISEVPVYPGGKKKTEAVTGIPTEDKVPGEGQIYYDIRFYIITPDKERIKIIINVEIQKDFYPGYDLVTRGVFYCARMLSAQMDTEFAAENYDDLKKVYSIWLCLNAPDYLADTVTQFSIKQENIIGEFKKETRYDLMSVVMICFNEKSWKRKVSKLHGMLGTVFSEKLSAKEKEQILEEEYEIEAEKEVKEGIGSMCNLSDAIEERGIRKGLARGLERGLEQKLIEMVCRKLRKGKSLFLIAEELEEEESAIKAIYDAALSLSPDYDTDKVYAVLHAEA